MADVIRALATVDHISDQYQFEEDDQYRIGAGAFGSVYKAVHRASGQLVAIKVIDKTDDQYWTNSDGIDREIEILALLPKAHNIMECFEVLETDDKIYIVGEYFQGEELFNVVNNKLKLSEADACHYFYNLIKIMQSLEKQCIAHRDIKADNILVNVEKDLLMLIDFGFAVKYQPKELLSESCGTLLYAAPELHTKERYDPVKADIWSLGVLLYFMLSGFLPFYHQDPSMLSSYVMMGEYKMLSVINKEAQDLIRQLLCTSASERPGFQTILSHPWMNVRKLHGRDVHSVDWDMEYQIIESLAKERVLKDVMASEEKQRNFGITSEKDFEEITSRRERHPLLAYLRIVNNQLTRERVDQIKQELEEEEELEGSDDLVNEPSVAVVKSRVHSDKIANASRAVKSESSEEFDLDAEYDDTMKTVNNESKGGYRPYKNAKQTSNALLPDSKMYGFLQCKTIIPKRNRRLRKRCGSTIFMQNGSEEFDGSNTVKHIMRRGVSSFMELGLMESPTEIESENMLEDMIKLQGHQSLTTYRGDEDTPIERGFNKIEHQNSFTVFVNKLRILPDNLESDATRRHWDASTPLQRDVHEEPEEYRWNVSPISTTRYSREGELDVTPLNLDLSSISGSKKHTSRIDPQDSDFSSSNEKSFQEKQRSKFSLLPVKEEVECAVGGSPVLQIKSFHIDLLKVECDTVSDSDSPRVNNIRPMETSCMISHLDIQETAGFNEILPCNLEPKHEPPQIQAKKYHGREVVEKLLLGNTYISQLFRKKHRRFASSIDELAGSIRSQPKSEISDESKEETYTSIVDLKPLPTIPNSELGHVETRSPSKKPADYPPLLSSRYPKTDSEPQNYRRTATASVANLTENMTHRTKSKEMTNDSGGCASQYTGPGLKKNIDRLYRHLKIPVSKLREKNVNVENGKLKLKSESGSPVKIRNTIGLEKCETMPQTELMKEIADIRAATTSKFDNFTNIESFAEELRCLRPAFEEEEQEDEDRVSSQLSGTDKTAASIKAPPFQVYPLRGMDPDCFMPRGLDLVTDLSTNVVKRIIKAILLKNGLDPYMVLFCYAD